MESNGSPELETNIESFWQQAQQTLQDFTSQTGSDTSEHNPGITLLEGVTARVTELAQQQTRPVNDLLVTKGHQGPVKVFHEEFEPKRILTCGPVTLDDYRRVLLDLHSQDRFCEEAFQEAFFFFSDVYIEKEPEENRYQYYFDSYNHTFKFKSDNNDDKKCSLLGNYSLYLVPSDELLNDDNLLNQATQALLQYLPTIENVGEKFSHIYWLTAEEQTLQLDIEVAGDISSTDKNSIAKIYAEIYQVVKNFTCASIERHSTTELRRQGLTSEDIYRGPFLEHGWIPEFTTARDYTSPDTLYLSHLLTNILAIEGIKKITDSGTQLELTVGASKFLSFGFTVDDVLKSVNLLTKGQLELEKNVDLIKTYIPSTKLIQNSDELSVEGESSKDVDYAPVTELIPACYHLSSVTPDESTKELHQFLLPIEQTLANESKLLSDIPNILGFDQTDQGGETKFWGYQQPFELGSPSDKVHQDYMDGIESFGHRKSEDYPKTIANLQNLMSYFNEAPGPNVLSKSQEDYVSSQRKLLANIPINQYYRAAYKNTEKRLAGKIGIDVSDITVIETRRALPLLPPASSFEEHNISIKESLEGRLKLHSPTLSDDFKPGMLVRLRFGETKFDIERLIIDEVRDDSLFIIIEGTSIEYHLEEILANETSVTVSASDTFLADVPFLLKEAQDLGDGYCQVTCVPFPELAKIGDSITMAASNDGNSLREVKYRITDINRYQHTLTLSGIQKTDINDKQFWYLEKDNWTERFSFTMSLALKKQVLKDDITHKWQDIENCIQEIIYSHLPSHCQVLIHWLDEDIFNRFKKEVNEWTSNNSPIGVTSYWILETLTLGRAPSQLEGIGYSFIATDEESDDHDQEYIDTHDIFQVDLA